MDKRKKILFLVTQSEFGGAQSFIYTLVTNLDQEKYSITVGTGLGGDDENGLLNLLKRSGIKTERLKYLKRSINPFFDLLGVIEIYKLIKKEKPDVLFLCSSKAGFLGSWTGKSLKIPKIIYRIGGWSFNDPWPNWKKKLYILVEKKSAKWKDYIINNAESDRQEAIKLNIKPKKEILTIYNGINIDKLEFLNKEEARKFLQFKDSDFIIGTIANDYPSKGLKYFKQAVEELKNIKSIIIGKGNRFIPEACRYLKAFDIFILPSVKEGFPWVVLEAMAAGIPAIATKVGALPEIIQDNKNGILIEPKNSKAIVNAVELLLNNKNLREKLSEEGRRTVIEKFNLEKMLKQYEDLFSNN